MDKKKMLLGGSVMMLTFFTLALLLASPLTVTAAEKCYIISVKGRVFAESGTTLKEAPIEASPYTLRIPVGSCAVFISWVQGADIWINFEEGKKCEDATGVPVGFTLDPKLGCYVTNILSAGQTSSLRFMKEGTYKYKIQIPGKVAPVADGEIVCY